MPLQSTTVCTSCPINHHECSLALHFLSTVSSGQVSLVKTRLVTTGIIKSASTISFARQSQMRVSHKKYLDFWSQSERTTDTKKEIKERKKERKGVRSQMRSRIKQRASFLSFAFQTSFFASDRKKFSALHFKWASKIKINLAGKKGYKKWFKSTHT